MQANPPHEIRQVAVLDLTGSGAESTLEGVTRIVNVATILAPERTLPRLSSIPMENVATIVPIPDGSRVRLMSGQVVLSGEALANPNGDPDEVLVIAGQLVITTPVERVGYKSLVVAGQLLAPRGSETGLGGGLTRMAGQLSYYPYYPDASVRILTGTGQLSGAELANTGGQPSDVLLSIGRLVIEEPVDRVGFAHIVVTGHALAPKTAQGALAGKLDASGGLVYYTAPPRVFDGKETFYGGFFELFDEPITLVLHGKFVFDEDVAPEIVKQKVATIVLDGKIVAPRRLVPMLQFLAVARDGKIVASDAADD